MVKRHDHNSISVYAVFLSTHFVLLLHHTEDLEAFNLQVTEFESFSPLTFVLEINIYLQLVYVCIPVLLNMDQSYSSLNFSVDSYKICTYFLDKCHTLRISWR